MSDGCGCLAVWALGLGFSPRVYCVDFDLWKETAWNCKKIYEYNKCIQILVDSVTKYAEKNIYYCIVDDKNSEYLEIVCPQVPRIGKLERCACDHGYKAFTTHLELANTICHMKGKLR